MNSNNSIPRYNKKNIHYKYKLNLELGIDPYEVPDKIVFTYDTWLEVCKAIYTHLGQRVDETDENIAHCGKWYVTNHGRGKIIQVVDFYTYEYEDKICKKNYICKLF